MIKNSSNLLRLYIISCHVDKPLTQQAPMSAYDCAIQAGAALTDKRICSVNDLDDCDSNISARNDRYSEASAMYWIGQHIDTEYTGIMHYRRRLQLSDEAYEAYIDQGVDIITTEPIDLGKSIEEDYREVLYAADWDLFMDILKKNAPGDYDFAVDCFRGNMIHACNINVFRSKLYKEFCDWAFPILDTFYRESPVKTDVYQHRDVGFIAERLSHLYVMKMKQRQMHVVEARLIDLRSDEWDCKTECDYNDCNAIWEACERLYDSHQITKCCNVIGEAKRRGQTTDERLSRLSAIMVAGILERHELPLTMHEYLPKEYRSSLTNLMQVWEMTERALRIHLESRSSESKQILDKCIAMTRFSKTALREMGRRIRLESGEA